MPERVPAPPGGCPLHNDRRDRLFVRSPHFPLPICGVCALELDGHFSRRSWHELSYRDQRWAERAESVSGLSWNDLRAQVIEQQLSYWEALERDRAGGWIDVMLRHGWSLERCLKRIRDEIERLLRAYDGIGCE